MLKIFGRLIGLKGDDLKYDSENLFFILIGIIFFILLGFSKAINKEDILIVESFLQAIFYGLNIDLSYLSNIAEFQNNNLYAIIYFSIAFLLGFSFITLRFIYNIKLFPQDNNIYSEAYKEQPETYSETKEV